jgi:hypothetical protein
MTRKRKPRPGRPSEPPLALPGWILDVFFGNNGDLVFLLLGPGAQICTGLPLQTLCDDLCGLHRSLHDGGNLLRLRHADHTVRLYARRCGRMMHVGARKDFEQMGWQGVCDRLDQQQPED